MPVNITTSPSLFREHTCIHTHIYSQHIVHDMDRRIGDKGPRRINTVMAVDQYGGARGRLGFSFLERFMELEEYHLSSG